MTTLSWQKIRSLENSLADYLQSIIDGDSLTVVDDNGNSIPINVRVGFEVDNTWTLPTISLYFDSKLSPRGFVGNNLRFKQYLMVIDIRTLNKGMQIDLAEWLEQTINDGFPLYDYAPNESDPDNPSTTLVGQVNVDFISNIPLKLGDNVDLLDKYRQNIVISCTF